MEVLDRRARLDTVRVPLKRRIIDRRALIAEIDAIAAQEKDVARRRHAVLALARTALEDGRAEIRRRLEAREAGGAATVAAGAHLVDQMVKLLFDFAFERAYPLGNPTAGERLAVVAVGGYGRGELAPFSDIDLLFVTPYKPTAHTEQVVEYLLYFLWDLGLKVGHSVRPIDECMRLARKDLTIRTTLLEARHIAGDRRLTGELVRRYAAEVMDGTEAGFVTAKLAERDKRHARMGDSRYVLEPNVKEGKGGLRDLHTLLWIGEYVYRVRSIADLVKLGVLTGKEAARFDRAQNFLWTLRCHLHYLSGRAEEVLTFDVQPAMARRLGYRDHAGASGVERFMKHYFLTAKTVGDLTRIFCAAIEAEHRRLPRLPFGAGRERMPVEGFVLEGGRLTVPDDEVFDRDPVNLIRLFHLSLKRNLDIHPNALRLVTRRLGLVDAGLRAEPEANRLFMEILTSPRGPEATLRRLNEAGVFGRFVPDFGRVVAQMQFDMYHVYTVDEHTIRAIGILSRIEHGQLREDHPVASEVIHKVISRRVLYAALLFHDVAKGRGGNHPEKGARIAMRECPRLGLDEEETEAVAWLVRHHTEMSQTAFQRDLADPKTIEDFVELVRSPERLRLLLVLTVCDIRAVGPGVWNAWKAALLRELYFRTEEVMSDGATAARAGERVAAAEARLRGALADWPFEAVEEHLACLPHTYLLSTDLDGQRRHAELVRRVKEAGGRHAVDVRVDRARAVTEVTVCTPDRPGLFASLAGAMAVAGADITNARIATTADGLALDSFLVQEPAPLIGEARTVLDDERRIAAIKRAVADGLSGRLDVEAALAGRRVLPARAMHFPVPPRVLIDDKASATHTVVEVNGRDRAGLLYALTRALSAMKLQISSAKISTFGEQVVDVFYVKDAWGLKVSHPARLDEIRAGLLAVLHEGEAAAGAPVAAE